MHPRTSFSPGTAVLVLALALAGSALVPARIAAGDGVATIHSACRGTYGCPNRIFLRPARAFDRIDFRAEVDLPPDFAPLGEPVVVTLENADGEIFTASLAAGGLHRSDRRFLARDTGAPREGFQRIELRPVPDGAWRISFVALGDLSTATLAEMTVTIAVGSHVFRSTDLWQKRAFGWLLHVGKTPASPTPSAKPTATLVPTPTPSASPTATATPASTPTPTVKPTATPSPTPTPRPTSSPSPTPTPTPKPTPTPTPTAKPTATPTATQTPVQGCTSATVTVMTSYAAQSPPDFVAGVTTSVGYPGARIGIPGHGNDATVLARVTNLSGASGLFSAGDQDANSDGVDDLISVGLISTSAAIPSGSFARIVFDCAPNAAAPTAADFTCTPDVSSLFGNGVAATCSVVMVQTSP